MQPRLISFLLVSNDKTEIELLQHHCKKIIPDNPLFIVNSGDKALSMMQEKFIPQVIIATVKEIEFIKELESTLALKNLPVLVIQSLEDDEELFYFKNVYGVIYKPITTDSLIEALAKLPYCWQLCERKR